MSVQHGDLRGGWLEEELIYWPISSASFVNKTPICISSSLDWGKKTWKNIKDTEEKTGAGILSLLLVLYSDSMYIKKKTMWWIISIFWHWALDPPPRQLADKLRKRHTHSDNCIPIHTDTGTENTLRAHTQIPVQPTVRQTSLLPPLQCDWFIRAPTQPSHH